MVKLIKHLDFLNLFQITISETRTTLENVLIKEKVTKELIFSLNAPHQLKSDMTKVA